MMHSQHTPAPRRLGVLLDFVNSVDRQDYAREGINEAFESRHSATEFLRRQQLLLPTESLTTRDLDRLRSLRESLRRLLASNNGQGDAESAWQALGAEITTARFSLVFRREGAHRTARMCANGTGATRIAATMIEQLHDAFVHGDFARLKACASGPCLWAFYDASKNGSAIWCSMAVCGNRAKARRRRQRESAQARAPRNHSIEQARGG